MTKHHDRNVLFARLKAQEVPGGDNCRVYAMAQCFEIITKIGITSNLRSRLSMVQTGCHLPVEYVTASLPMSRKLAREIEAEVHSSLIHLRRQGEWFEINPFAARDFLELSYPGYFIR